MSESLPELPSLPEPAGFCAGTHDGALFTLKRSTGNNFAKGAQQPLQEWFTAAQMHAYATAYARACVLAEREACAALCDDTAEHYGPDGHGEVADYCAETIRARGQGRP